MDMRPQYHRPQEHVAKPSRTAFHIIDAGDYRGGSGQSGPPVSERKLPRLSRDRNFGGADSSEMASIRTSVPKIRMVARLLPPESSAIDLVSRDVGISVATLERWRADALASGSPAGSPRWTAAARLQAVIVTAAMDEATRGALVAASKETCPGGARCLEAGCDRRPRRAAGGCSAGGSSGGTGCGSRSWSSELHRKDKALAETGLALLVLSKKLSAIFHEGECTA